MRLIMLFQTSPSVVGMLLQAFLAIVVPLVATWVLTQVTKLNAVVEKWQDWEKRLIAAAYGVIIAGIAHGLGLALPDAWGALSGTDIQAILATLGAMLLHRVLNPPAATR